MSDKTDDNTPEENLKSLKKILNLLWVKKDLLILFLIQLHMYWMMVLYI